MTRTDKMVALKRTSLTTKIDLPSCSNDELDKLMEITNLKKNTFTMTTGWAFVNQLVENQKKKARPAIGKFL